MNASHSYVGTVSVKTFAVWSNKASVKQTYCTYHVFSPLVNIRHFFSDGFLLYDSDGIVVSSFVSAVSSSAALSASRRPDVHSGEARSRVGVLEGPLKREGEGEGEEGG